MMLVVGDSSPLIVLINVGHIDLLPNLFGQVTIPPEVAAELARDNRPTAVRTFVGARPSWLIVQAPANIEPIPSLHAGERAAISLARELNADLLLIDETCGRRAAEERRIPLTGTVGILELAATEGRLDLKDAFERVKQTDFWISHRLLDERLRLFQERGHR